MGSKSNRLKQRPDGAPIWYAAEWLRHLDKKQSFLVAKTTYTKSQVSEWVTCRQRFNADVLHTFAKALGIEASDLLRPPSQADDEIAREIRKLDVRQREKALRLLRAADILPGSTKAA
jgi:transcriptional regulator with XRE-family HTH domain